MRGNPEGLDSFRWEHRVLLIYTECAEAASTMAATLAAADEAIEERDLLWFLVTSGECKDNAGSLLDSAARSSLREWILSWERSPTEVRLVGKDGGTKARHAELDLPRIFALIDSMPMRKAEMRR
jgi:hypothetical protein